MAEVLEDYLAYFTGSPLLLLHVIEVAKVMHAVWGIEKDTGEPAALITAYRPDTRLWSDDFRTRKP